MLNGPVTPEHLLPAIDPAAESMTTKLVSFAELARLSGVHRATLYRWQAAGRLPPGVELDAAAPGVCRYRVHVPTVTAFRRERAA